MKPMQEIETLALAIVDAVRTSFHALFDNGERYYYCTLYTTGEGHAPSLSAWSWEALEREAARQGEEATLHNCLWSVLPFGSLKRTKAIRSLSSG